MLVKINAWGCSLAAGAPLHRLCLLVGEGYRKTSYLMARHMVVPDGLNIITPVILLALGLILPVIARLHENDLDAQ